ncbi:hypothetical protein CWATWH0005_1412 [Crocosphaera watsonii WH 0005]|uniref:Uncharacterized protein n=1 Tax=Crocosphaera watsonii WH 0005 TaxID=423472 RepID=T2IPS4_CROWT|nr:hypothetical protein CWATWH0005_1412 [Crocosphaera watsonii WH 0005]
MEFLENYTKNRLTMNYEQQLYDDCSQCLLSSRLKYYQNLLNID